jgi:hypothetical protein
MLPPTRPFVVLGFVACFAAPGASAQAPDFDCSRFAHPGEHVTVVGLTDAITPASAPVPGNDSERLLFRQLYETLLRVTCDGRLAPGLATTWQRDADGGAWLVTLRENARFSDGTPVTAREVIAGWMRGGSTLAPESARLLRTAAALDDRTLSLVFHQQGSPAAASATAIAQLAAPALAVAKTVPGAAWPLGTRGLRVDDAHAPASDGRTTITLVRSGAGDPTSPAGADVASPPDTLRFLVSSNGDGRDLLDRGVDLLITREPATLAYGSALGRFDSIPLPWSRTYIFLSRDRSPEAALTAPLRQQLALDAVPGEAQGSPLHWGAAWNDCALATAPTPPPEAAPRPRLEARLVYPQSDPVARALAERVVVLTSSNSERNGIGAALFPAARPSQLRAVSLPDPVLPSALTRGDDAGYLVSIQRGDGCAGVTALREQAPWVTGDRGVALVDTRSRVLVRTGRSQVTMEGDGIPLIGTPSR